MTSHAMKVRITVTLDIDPEAWAYEYDCEPSEIRQDVQTWAADALTQHLASLGLGAQR